MKELLAFLSVFLIVGTAVLLTGFFLGKNVKLVELGEALGSLALVSAIIVILLKPNKS